MASIESESLNFVLNILKEAPRIGSTHDSPEGSRYIQISDTLAYEMTRRLEGLILGKV